MLQLFKTPPLQVRLGQTEASVKWKADWCYYSGLAVISSRLTYDNQLSLVMIMPHIRNHRPPRCALWSDGSPPDAQMVQLSPNSFTTNLAPRVLDGLHHGCMHPVHHCPVY